MKLINHSLAIEYLDPASLKPSPHHARTHSRKQLRALTRSFERFGCNEPVLIDAEGVIIVGHARVLAAKALGLASIPSIRIEHLSPDELRAYAIAANKLAEKAGWDRDILRGELRHLLTVDHTLPEVMGFDPGEIDVLLTAIVDPDDESLPEMPGEPVTRLGDLWRLRVGPKEHRVLCGDARESTAVALLMQGDLADCVFTDPPYNLEVNKVVGKGAIQHPEFAMASGEMSKEAFTAFLHTIAERMIAVSRDGAVHFICMDWRHLAELLAACERLYGGLLNICVWRKSNAGMGSLYRSQHELVFVFKNGSAPHLNAVELGRHGRNRTNVWDYPSVNTFRADRREQLSWHPTVKPAAMVMDAVQDVTRRGDLVLDPFLGSGTTLVACERTGRRCRAMEIDPLYVDLALRRWSEATGIEPILAETGETFSEVAARRAADAPAALDAPSVPLLEDHGR